MLLKTVKERTISVEINALEIASERDLVIVLQ
jgi:hypothetical protein